MCAGGFGQVRLSRELRQVDRDMQALERRRAALETAIREAEAAEQSALEHGTVRANQPNAPGRPSPSWPPGPGGHTTAERLDAKLAAIERESATFERTIQHIQGASCAHIGQHAMLPCSSVCDRHTRP